MIAIFTIRDDLHALVVQKEVQRRGAVCHVIEVDQLWNRNMIHVDFFQKKNFYLLNNKGNVVNIEDLQTIWWRRSVSKQSFNHSDLEEEYRGFVNYEFEASLFGLIHSKFKGTWISHPFATKIASNKIMQADLASQAGFVLPVTIFSQDSDKIIEFINLNDFEVIIKPMYGNTKKPMYTKKIDKLNLPHNDAFNVCPAIYQEFIPGTVHFRINVFGDKIY